MFIKMVTQTDIEFRLCISKMCCTSSVF